MYFSESFLQILIIASLTGIGLAAIALVIMFVKDVKSKELW